MRMKSRPRLAEYSQELVTGDRGPRYHHRRTESPRPGPRVMERCHATATANTLRRRRWRFFNSTTGRGGTNLGKALCCRDGGAAPRGVSEVFNCSSRTRQHGAPPPFWHAGAKDRGEPLMRVRSAPPPMTELMSPSGRNQHPTIDSRDGDHMINESKGGVPLGTASALQIAIPGQTTRTPKSTATIDETGQSRDTRREDRSDASVYGYTTKRAWSFLRSR